MSKGKFAKRKGVASKTLVIALAVMLVVGCTIGGTLAWLTDTTDEVTNTFTVGNIDIELFEHELDDLLLDALPDDAEEVTSQEDYKIIPGTTQPKDPTVRVIGGSEDSIVFLQVMETDNEVNDKRVVSFDVDTAWTVLTDKDSNPVTVNGVPVYYMTYNSQADDVEYDVLSGKIVTYSDDLTKDDLDGLDEVNPTLTFKAFAVQLSKSNTTEFSELEAWDMIEDSEKLGYVAPTTGD